MNWFYEADGKQQGPVSEAELERLLRSGVITGATLVWREGQGDWQPLQAARPAETAGTERCSSCGGMFPETDLVQIGGRSICPNCKPAALQSLQQGGFGLEADEAGRTGPAWEHREELGVAKAAWWTIRDVLTKPAETFATMKREGGHVNPIIFRVALGTITGLLGVLLQLILRARGIQPPTLPLNGLTAQLNQSSAFLIAMAVLQPLGQWLYAYVGAAVFHLCLMLCGGAQRPFETTLRVTCYAQGATMALQGASILLAMVGGNWAFILGSSVVGIWALACTCIGLAKAHVIETWRAVLAVLLPVVVCCAGIGLLVAAVFAVAAKNGLH